MLNTTVGQLLINDVLPEELRDSHRVLDKKGLQSLLQQVAQQHPERYKDISFKLSGLGQSMAQEQGGMSFGLRHLQVSKAALASRQKVRATLTNILSDESLTDQQRNEQIIRAVGKESPEQQKQVLAEALLNKNPLGMQVMSGTRGKSMNLTSLLGSDMLYSDQRDDVIPIPVLRSYSEGLSPAEYWAGTYGARKGIMATKFATQDAGFFNKQLNQTSHRLVVTGEDAEEAEDAPIRGLVVDTDDADNEGALLARAVGPYARNTHLTPKILNHLKRLGTSKILVRSALVGGSPDGGVYARDVGIRETGKLPGLGEQVGLQAAHALSEPISQGQLSAKHSGGVAGQEKAVSGFQYLNQLVQVPKKMQGGAAHALKDGVVQRIEEAPAGGSYVTIGDKQHYVGAGFELKVKKGDEVEAGDVISSGIPNPATITEHKGVGEGRRYFVNEFRKAMGDSGMFGHRRNIEVLARGLINHVRLTEETDDHVPDDIVPYSTIEHTYKPREDHQRLTPKRALGQYLERPILHYTIGTKIRPSMLKNFQDFEINEIPVHKNPPPFEPHMVRGLYQMQHDPDWMTQMYGSGLKKSFLDSVTHGAVSEERGTSFVPSLAMGLDFGEGKDHAVIKPKPSYELPATPTPPALKPIAPSNAPFFGGRFTPGQTKLAMDSVPDVSKPPSVSKPPAVSKPIPNTPATEYMGGPAPRNGSNSPEHMEGGVAPRNNTEPHPYTPAADLSPNIMPALAPTPAPTPAPAPAPSLYDTYKDTDAKGDQGTSALAPPPASTPTPTSNSDQFNHFNYLMQNNSNFAGQAGQMLNQNPLMGLMMLGGMAGGGNFQQLFNSRPSQGLATSNNNGLWGNMLNMFGGGAQNNGGQGQQNLNQSPQSNAPSSSPAPAANQGGMWNSMLNMFGGGSQPATPAESAPAAEAPKEEGSAATSGPSVGTAFTYAPIGAAVQGAKNMIMPPKPPPILPPPIPGMPPPLPKAPPGLFGKATSFAGKAFGKAMVPLGVGMEAIDVGSNIYNKGWDNTTNDAAQNWRNILSFKDGLHTAWQAPVQALNPVANAQLIAGGATQTAGMLGEQAGMAGEAIRDKVTGTDARSRASVADKTQVNAMEVEKQKGLEAQLALTKPQNLEGTADLKAQIQDAKTRQGNTADETANWRLGQQNWFGSGGHKFRDAMQNSATAADTELAELKAKGELDAGGQARQEQLLNRQAQRKQMLGTYDREGGATGKGLFSADMRNRVSGLKENIVAVGAKLRDPSLPPEERAKLEAQLKDNNENLAEYRGWAESSK